MNISPNYSALVALNQLDQNTKRTQKIMTRAALGEKLASAGDGASEYAISEKMKANIRSLDQDIVNASTGNRMIDTAASAIEEIVNNLRSIKELAINSANDSNTDADRAIMQKEVDQRLDEIDNIAASTNYNGKYLLHGDYSRYVVYTPTSGGGTVDISGLPTVGSPSVPYRENTLTDLLSKFGLTGSAGPMLYHGIKCDIVCSRPNSFKVDFSGAKKADGTLVGADDYPDAFDKQGFAMGCQGCDTFINIMLSKDIDAESSTVSYVYEGSGYGERMMSYQYVIGIKDVTDEKSLEKAFFDGVLAANTKDTGTVSIGSDSYETTYTSPSGEPYLGQLWRETHNVRLSYDADTESCYLKSDGGPPWPFFTKGTIVSKDMPAPGDEPGEPTIQVGNPLIIHTGTKSSQHLRVYIESMYTEDMGIKGLKINTQDRAEAALSRIKGSTFAPDTIGPIDHAIEYALGEATRLGAYHQELEFTQNNLTTQSENVTNAESVIRDADMAKTMTEYSKYNVLSQSAQAMLAQANQNVNHVLDLLQ